MDATVIQCTICSSKMKLPSTHFGKKLKCPKCQAILVTTAEGKLAKAISAEQAQAAKQQQAATAGGQAKAKPATAKTPQAKAAAQKPAAQQPKAATQKTATQKTAAAPAAKQATAKTAPAKAAKPEAGKKAAEPKAGAAAGKGKLVMAKAAAPKKKGGGVRVDKEKMGGLKRRSVKDRVEALDHQKDTTRIIGLIATVSLILSVAGTIAWFVFFGDDDQAFEEPFENVVLAVDPELSESRTIDFQYEGELVTIQLYQRNTDGMEFVKIPAGTYTIGGGKRANERPEVEVTVPEFYIGYDEVTARQFRQFTHHLQNMSRQMSLAREEIEAWERRAPNYARRLKARIIHFDTTVYNHPYDNNTASPSNFGRDDEAAHHITWYEAYRYQVWANGMRPEFGILPTEVDWEVAARGLRGTIYPWGNTAEDLLQRTHDNNRVGDMRRENRAEYIRENFGWVSEVPVDGVAPSDAPATPRNGFGLRNIYGNAAEYTWDHYSAQLYDYVRDINEPEHRAFGATGGAETLRTYNARTPQRSVRISSIGLRRDQIADSRFTRRVEVEPGSISIDNLHEKSVGFRAVFYPDGTAPYGDELAPLIELYKFRQVPPDWEATDGDGNPTWTPEAEEERRRAFEERIKEQLRTWHDVLD